MTFEDIMSLTPANKTNYEALREAIKKHTVVPFVGAGMSYPYYPLWNKALQKLQEKIAPERMDAVNKELASVTTEIERCDILERNLGKRATCRELCNLFSLSKFDVKKAGVDTQAASLFPRLFPREPLLTTNLERMQEEIFRHYDVPFDSVLNPTDSDILTVLKQKRAHGILYLHGCVSGDLTDYSRLVFSKSQYDKHYQDNTPLVKELRNWMNGAQLLFLGCSLRNDRTLEILKKIFGTNNRLEHFAILDVKDEDLDYTERMIQLEHDYGIRAILYPKDQHEAVRILLQRLIDDIRSDGVLPYPGVRKKDTDATKYQGASFLVGREEQVDNVIREMRSPGVPILIVQGVAGIGKTEICKAAFRKIRMEDPGFEMPFHDLTGVDGILKFYELLAKSLGISFSEISGEDVDEYLLSAVSLHMNGRVRWFYLDNFEALWLPLAKSERRSLSDFLCRFSQAGIRLLISSQVSIPPFKTIPVGPLDGEIELNFKSSKEFVNLHRAKLFQDVLGRNVRENEQKAFVTLLEETSGHPLSIVLTASYGRDCGSLEELLESWHKVEQHIPGEPESHDSLTRALALAWSSVEKQKAAVRRWALHNNSMFALDGDTLRDLRDGLPTRFSDSEWTDGGRLLRGMGLISTGEDGEERMLLAVKKAFSSLLTDKAVEDEALDAWVSWGNKLLTQGDDRHSKDYYAFHDHALKWFPQCLHLADMCLEKRAYDSLARLLNKAGNFYKFDSLSSLELLGKILREVPGDFPLRDELNNYIGDLLSRTGKLEEALEAYGEAEELYQSEKSNLGLANVLRSRGDLLSRTGKLEEALEAYGEAEELYQSEKDNLGLANVLQSRGDLRQTEKEWDSAIASYEKALKLYIGEHDSMDVCYVLAELQFCEKRIGKESEALNHTQMLMELLPSQPEPVQKYCRRKII